MGRIPENYMERVYAGWLAKIIGIRHGAPIEGWDYWKIRDIIGRIDGYLVDYRDFAADDDSNGPLFFLRGLETAKDIHHLEPMDVAGALLNYAPYEHGFFWWGGYGISTEHTAYLNLRSGVPAPESGSITQNGATVAEQIGGQIFIDTWGLVSPGNPEQAARLARAAASVMHGGNGVYGGIFVAVCISLAFVERDVEALIRKALGYIPADCEYARVVQAVLDFHAAHSGEGWRKCFEYLWDNFGYDRYPGACHIIPNAGVMILALLYGEGDFTRTINICNMCGWDTDCNVGNIATMMGVLVGVEGIDYDKWIAPVHDLLICSSVMGSLNIMDIPYGASYIAQWAYRLAGEPVPEPYASAFAAGLDSCHFEYPGSTHSIRVRGEDPAAPLEAYLRNTDEQARTGRRSLRIGVPGLRPTDTVYAYRKTYYYARDFHDSRYDPCFSPVVYPGEIMRASVFVADQSCPVQACLYVHEGHGDRVITSAPVAVGKGQWTDLEFRIPPMDGGLIDEAGVRFRVLGEHGAGKQTLVACLDDLCFDGRADYAVELDRERTEVWTAMHREVTQFTRLKGLMYLEEGRLHLSCADFAEAYTGRHDWTDYDAAFRMAVHAGEHAFANFRVQGAMRSYAVGFDGAGRFALLKNDNGYAELAATDFAWEKDRTYEIQVQARGGRLIACCGDAKLEVEDPEPWSCGAVGLSLRQGTHASLERVSVRCV